MKRGALGPETIGLLLLVPPPLFWAGNFIVGRAMRGDVPPLTLSFWRWAIAFVFLLPFAWRPMRRDRALYWRHRWQILKITIVGVVAFNSLVYVGLQWTAAANGLLLNSFIPILIVLLGAMFFGQRLRIAQGVGMAVSFCGVLTIILHGEWARLLTLEFSQGDVVVFAAMVCWALYTLWLRGIPPEIDRIGLMGVQIGVAFVFLVPMYLGEIAYGYAPVWRATSFGALAYLGIFPSVLAYLLYNIGVARVGAARAGLFTHLVPAFGVVLAVLFLHEPIRAYHAIGMAAILAGIACAVRARPAPQPLAAEAQK